MKLTKYVLAVATLSLFANLALQAQAQDPVTNSRPDCILDRDDPYEPGAVMTADAYQGQCQDASIKRAPWPISGVPGYPASNEYVFANFRHDGRFWIAHMPKHGVQRAIFQFVGFDQKIIGPIKIYADHLQTRFVMKPGYAIKLYPQKNVDQATPTGRAIEITDFVASFNHMSPPGVPFSAIRGKDSTFNHIIRFLSTEEQIIEQGLIEKRNIDQYELKFEGARLDYLLKITLERAVRDGYAGIYNTFRNSCTTSAINLLKLAKHANPHTNPAKRLDDWYPAIWCDAFRPKRHSVCLTAMHFRGFIAWKARRWDELKEFETRLPELNAAAEKRKGLPKPGVPLAPETVDLNQLQKLDDREDPKVSVIPPARCSHEDRANFSDLRCMIRRPYFSKNH